MLRMYVNFLCKITHITFICVTICYRFRLISINILTFVVMFATYCNIQQDNKNILK